MSFIAELRRRNVIRVAGLYLVGGWLVLQVAETLLPIFDTPAWVLKALVVLLALGFIPALAFAWVFELTPEGLKREHEVDRSQSVVDRTARKLDIAVIVLLLAVGGLMLWQNQRAPAVAVPVAATGDAADAGATGTTPASGVAKVTDKSIAVLPFADFSPGGDQAWFADGLTDEILNSLARTPDLQVSARTSSFAYKGSTLAIPEIAAKLGVAHILEGSVRSTPERIRVTAQLVRAADGFHLWSQTYDRDVADMIQIQEDLATQIAIAMQTTMDPKALADMAQAGTRSVEAYQAHIRGVAKTLAQNPDDYQLAYEYFEQARKLDPTFAAAHARAASYWVNQLDPSTTLSGLSNLTVEEMTAAFDERIGLAIKHAPTETDRLRYRALKAFRDLRLRESLSLTLAFMAERPLDAEGTAQLFNEMVQLSEQALLAEQLDAIWPAAQQQVDVALAHVNYSYRTTDKKKAADRALVLADRWSDQAAVLYQAHRALLWDRRVDEARTVLERLRAVTPESSQWSMIPPARQACAEGRRDEVERILAELPADDIAQNWHVLTLLGREADADAVLMPLERAGNTYALSGFLAYPNFDPTPFPSLMAVLAREKVQRPAPLPLPFACPPAQP